MKVRLLYEILNYKSQFCEGKKEDVSVVFLVTAFSCEIMTECVPLHWISNVAAIKFCLILLIKQRMSNFFFTKADGKG